jgi:hypothetical protein
MVEALGGWLPHVVPMQRSDNIEPQSVETGSDPKWPHAAEDLGMQLLGWRFNESSEIC